MKVTWSDDLDSSSSDNKDNVANICFMAIEINIKESREYGELFLDSTCSRHMTKDYSLFSSISKINGGKVTFRDNLKGKVIGVSNIGGHTRTHGCRPRRVGLKTHDTRAALSAGARPTPMAADIGERTQDQRVWLAARPNTFLKWYGSDWPARLNTIGSYLEAGPNSITPFGSVLGLAAKPEPTAFDKEGNAYNHIWVVLRLNPSTLAPAASRMNQHGSCP
ncbi:hypothetical protein NC651_007802 [Populus alba x Populus x berolinensis]|nr:hypothetical protein NC651_007802 [Populus alba x Populus x berolinensis]